MFDAVWPPGRLYYNKSAITRRPSEAAIECLVEHGAYNTDHPQCLRVHEAYGINYRGVAALKAEYDPTNFLSGNANIKSVG